MSKELLWISRRKFLFVLVLIAIGCNGCLSATGSNASGDTRGKKRR